MRVFTKEEFRWPILRCDVCYQAVEELILFDNNGLCESQGVVICKECLEKALLKLGRNK